MKLEDYMSALEAKLGTIVDVQECCPGVYDIEVDEGARFHKGHRARSCIAVSENRQAEADLSVRLCLFFFIFRDIIQSAVEYFA